MAIKLSDFSSLPSQEINKRIGVPLSKHGASLRAKATIKGNSIAAKKLNPITNAAVNKIQSEVLRASQSKVKTILNESGLPDGLKKVDDILDPTKVVNGAWDLLTNKRELGNAGLITGKSVFDASMNKGALNNLSSEIGRALNSDAFASLENSVSASESDYERVKLITGIKAKNEALTDTINNPNSINAVASSFKPNANLGAKSPAYTRRSSAVGTGDKLSYPMVKNKENPSHYTCILRIHCFNYVYDRNELDGNKRVLDNENRTPDKTTGKAKVTKKYTIDLPLPANLTAGFSSTFSNYDNVWAKLVRAYNSTNNSGDNVGFDTEPLLNRLAEKAGDSSIIKDSAKIGLMSASFAGLNSGSVSSAVSAGAGDALGYLRVAGGFTANPMSQAVYTGTPGRTHSFEFQMVPRNEEEQEAINKIIENLQFSSVGGKTTGFGGLLVDFPDMFNVQFLTPFGNPIFGLFEIPDSFIETIQVSSSPTRGLFQIIPGRKNPANNYPFAYTLRLTFKEIENLTRNDLKFLRQTPAQFAGTYKGALSDEFDPNKHQIADDEIMKFIGSSTTGTPVQSQTEAPPPSIKLPDGAPAPSTFKSEKDAYVYYKNTMLKKYNLKDRTSYINFVNDAGNFVLAANPSISVNGETGIDGALLYVTKDLYSENKFMPGDGNNKPVKEPESVIDTIGNFFGDLKRKADIAISKIKIEVPTSN